MAEGGLGRGEGFGVVVGAGEEGDVGRVHTLDALEGEGEIHFLLDLARGRWVMVLVWIFGFFFVCFVAQVLGDEFHHDEGWDRAASFTLHGLDEMLIQGFVHRGVRDEIHSGVLGSLLPSSRRRVCDGQFLDLVRFSDYGGHLRDFRLTTEWTVGKELDVV